MNKTRTRTCTIYIDKEGILHARMHKGVSVDYEDALDNMLVMNIYTKRKPSLKLIDARASFSIDKKAREFVNNIDAKHTIARAVLKNSTLSRLLSTFFSNLSKPKTPTKIFTDYDEAYDWLLEMKEKMSKLDE